MALIGSLTSGVSALDSFEQGLEVIGNNIANVNTTGFKGQTVDYSDTFSDVLQEATPGTASSGGGAASNASSSRVSGWRKARRQAWSACPGMRTRGSERP